MTVQEVWETVDRDRAFYAGTGGGVTLSGGEPTAQANFSIELLRQLKRNGIHTAVETCGYAEWDILREMAKVTDLFLYDIKTPDSKKHEELTGVPNDKIVANLEKLAMSLGSLVIRYPLVPGYNDSKKEIASLCDLAITNGIGEIDIMPFHKFGLHKYGLLGMRPRPGELRTPSPEEIARVSRMILNTRLQLKVGG